MAKLSRRRLMAATVAVVMASASGTASAATPSCRAGQTLAASTQVRVFGIDRHPGDSFRLRDDYRAYACYLRTGRVRAVGTFSRSETSAVGAFLPVASGRFVAYDLVDCGRDGCEGGGIRVLDVRSGRKRASTRTSPGSDVVTGLAVKTNGSVAWIRPVASPNLEVRRLDRQGEAVLDAGADIERDSLALARSTVYWTRGGAARSAQID